MSSVTRLLFRLSNDIARVTGDRGDIAMEVSPRLHAQLQLEWMLDRGRRLGKQGTWQAPPEVIVIQTQARTLRVRIADGIHSA